MNKLCLCKTTFSSLKNSKLKTETKMSKILSRWYRCSKKGRNGRILLQLEHPSRSPPLPIVQKSPECHKKNYKNRKWILGQIWLREISMILLVKRCQNINKMLVKDEIIVLSALIVWIPRGKSKTSNSSCIKISRMTV